MPNEPSCCSNEIDHSSETTQQRDFRDEIDDAAGCPDAENQRHDANERPCRQFEVPSQSIQEFHDSANGLDNVGQFCPEYRSLRWRIRLREVTVLQYPVFPYLIVRDV